MEGGSQTQRSLQPTVTYVLAPMHKGALGVALGVTTGSLTALVTLLHVMIESEHPPVALLAQFFYGYRVSWRGVVVGFVWAFAFGFVLGWCLALVRNTFTALWLLSVRAKSALSAPFLDQI